MSDKASLVEQFVRLGLSHVGGGYVYGTNGEILTEALLKKKQAQLDPRRTGSFRPTYMEHIRAHYMGKYVADCSGLIVSICRDLGLDTKDYSASSLYYYKCNRKAISEIERGDLVFKKNSSSGKIYHVGIYLGAGEVLEAQGTMYGIRVNKLSSSWTLAGRLKVLGDEKAEPVKEWHGYYEVTLKYKNSRLNLRRSPGGEIISELVGGDVLEAYNESQYNDGHLWVKVVSLNTGEVGWVASEYLTGIDELPHDK
jgi:cell wall-associated NlpC family hydrolase